MVDKERLEYLRKKLDEVSMDEKDKIIIRTRFGLDDGIYRSLPATGRIFKMSPEGIRKVEQKFLLLIGENK